MNAQAANQCPALVIENLAFPVTHEIQWLAGDQNRLYCSILIPQQLPGEGDLPSIPAIKERVITVNGMAKGFAMTGWRIGFIGAAKWIVDGIDKLQGQVTSGTNSIARRASVVAWDDMTAPETMKRAYLVRRDLVIGLLKEIEGFKICFLSGVENHAKLG